MKHSVELHHLDVKQAVKEYLERRGFNVVSEIEFETVIVDRDYYDRKIEPFATFQSVKVVVEQKNTGGTT